MYSKMKTRNNALVHLTTFTYVSIMKEMELHIKYYDVINV